MAVASLCADALVYTIGWIRLNIMVIPVLVFSA